MGNIQEIQCMGTPLGADDGESSIAAQYETHIFPQKIGQGMFSKTYTCWKRGCEDERYALKVYESEGDVTDAIDHAMNEVEILQNMGTHPRIIELVEVDHDDLSTIRIVQELCEGGQLYDRLIEKGRYEELSASMVTRQILEAVQFIHSKGVMHRDIKPENILLVSSDSDVDIKVCDFGISKMKVGAETCPRSMSFTGSAFYVAPEMIRQKEYSYEIDIWAIGVITYALLSGSLPFVGANSDDLIEVYKNIVSINVNFSGDCWDECSDSAVSFVQKLLSFREERPSATQALALPWLGKGEFAKPCYAGA